jgi:hypothetical protein
MPDTKTQAPAWESTALFDNYEPAPGQPPHYLGSFCACLGLPSSLLVALALSYCSGTLLFGHKVPELNPRCRAATFSGCPFH